MIFSFLGFLATCINVQIVVFVSTFVSTEGLCLATWDSQVRLLTLSRFVVDAPIA